MHILSSRLYASATPRTRPVLIGTSTATNNSSPLTIPKPTGIAVGDLLIAAAISAFTGTGESWTNSDSFTELSGVDAGVNPTMVVATKVADAGDVAGSGWAFTCSRGGSSAAGLCVAYRDGAFQASGARSTNGSVSGPYTLTLSQVTVAGLVPILIAIAGSSDTGLTSNGSVPGMTEICATRVTARPCLVAFAENIETGASGTRTWTTTASGTIALGGILFNIGRS